MSKRKTNDEFLKEMKLYHPYIQVFDSYKDAYTKLKCKCLVCGNEWMGTPKEMTGSRKHGCPKCGIKSRNNNKRKSNEQFVSEFNAVSNGNIELIGEYVNSQTKIKCRCLIDGYEWESFPYHLLQGHGCPKCSNNLNLSQDEVKNRLGKNIELLSQYKSMHEKVQLRCMICDNEWSAFAYDVLNKNENARTGCPNCNGNIKYSADSFIDKLEKINNSIIVVGEYVNNHTKIECLCKKCGKRFYMKPSHLLDGHGCRHCTSSIGENKISQFLKNNNIEYIPQYYFNNLKGVKGRVLPYDFYLPKYNLLIEFQGKQHCEPVEYFGGEDAFNILKEHDKRKKEYAINNGYSFLEIWYYDIENINEILDEALSNNYILSA